MLRLAEVEVDKEERPLSPHKIRSSEVRMFLKSEVLKLFCLYY